MYDCRASNKILVLFFRANDRSGPGESTYKFSKRQTCMMCTCAHPRLLILPFAAPAAAQQPCRSNHLDQCRCGFAFRNEPKTIKNLTHCLLMLLKCSVTCVDDDLSHQTTAKGSNATKRTTLAHLHLPLCYVHWHRLQPHEQGEWAWAKMLDSAHTSSGPSTGLWVYITYS